MKRSHVVILVVAGVVAAVVLAPFALAALAGIIFLGDCLISQLLSWLGLW